MVRARTSSPQRMRTSSPHRGTGRSLDPTMFSPPLMLHRTRVDKMTVHDNESNEAWDREWTASPTYERVHSPWKSSFGKTSEEFLAASRTAGTRAEKKQLLDMARRADREEKAHQKLETFLDKTSRYSDRSRFRCIGTPLMYRDERHSMTLRSSGRLSLGQVQHCIPTPVCDTHHRFEAPGRGEAVLDRHKIERPAFLAGQRRGWEQAQHRIETGQQSARRVDVEGFGSKVRITFSKEGPSSDQTNLIAGESSYQAPAMDTERALYERRPISSYSKMNIRINGADQTFLVPKTANPPVEKRIFLSTHYSGWEGNAVGTRAPSPYEVKMDNLRGPPPSGMVRPYSALG